MVFPRLEKTGAIGERLNRQLRVPRQNALKITSPVMLSSRELPLILIVKSEDCFRITVGLQFYNNRVLLKKFPLSAICYFFTGECNSFLKLCFKYDLGVIHNFYNLAIFLN